MSAETLREAAVLMRARAEAVSATAPSPWFVAESEIVTDDEEPIEALSVITSNIHWRDAAAQRTHVASWHPAVALAVADWLDVFADEDWPYSDCGDRGDLCGYGPCRAQRQALNVARAYLGSDA
jgi:hypothetical protein